MWCQVIWNSKKSNNLLCRNFSMFINDFYFINLLLFSIFFLLQMFEQLFSRKISQWLFQLIHLWKKHPQKLLKNFLKIIYKCRKAHDYSLAFSLVSSSKRPFLFEKHSALIFKLFFHIPFWSRKYKKYNLFIISNLVDKSWKLSNC